VGGGGGTVGRTWVGNCRQMKRRVCKVGGGKTASGRDTQGKELGGTRRRELLRKNDGGDGNTQKKRNVAKR